MAAYKVLVVQGARNWAHLRLHYCLDASVRADFNGLHDHLYSSTAFDFVRRLMQASNYEHA